MGVQAWVTSAVDDKAVTKAIVLAASLRRVRTAKKLIVLTTLTVSKDLRDKLNDTFDLVLLVDHETPKGLNTEDYAKIQGFSLQAFNKCVYLAPQTLVFKNCDDLFEKYECFAISGEEDNFDSSVYLFTPSAQLRKALEKAVWAGDYVRQVDFSKNFKRCVENHVPNLEKLEKQYNVKIALNVDEQFMDADLTIANFSGIYPLEFSKERLQRGVVAQHAVEECWKLYEQQSLKVPPGPYHSPSSYETDPIAIVGLDFRLPGGNNPDDFWDLLVKGEEGIITLPPFRWTKEHTLMPLKSRQFQAGFLDFPIDEFDSKFFGVSPKDALFLDPQQRLLHEVTWCALEDTGIDPLTLQKSKTGIFVGSWIHDYKDIASRSTDVEFFRTYMGNSIAASAARLSHFLETTGPSIATESGCSSGIVAVDMACKSLRNHDSNLALACGVNLLLHPFDQSILDFVLSPSGRCKTFDAKADGFGRAEGCAVLALKRLSDAVREENKIWGLIRGSAVTQEGASSSFGTPTVHGESLAMELALKDAGVEPQDVSFVEAHGTGTSVGDPLEMAAIAKTYSRGRTDPLIVGSVKTNVGHTESVSGITGIIKVLLSLKHETIPPHLNLETLNPEINLDIIPAKIPLEPLPWPKNNDKPRLAGVSSFGISGTDGHVIIEEAPPIVRTNIDFKLGRPLHIMKLSAKSPESLEKLLETYESMFRKKSEEEDGFADFAYSTNTGRSSFNHRVVFCAKNFAQAAKIIKEKTFKQADISSQTSSSPLCFLFTGQGSQYPNMASELYKTSPVFRMHFEKCAKVLQSRYSIPIKQVIWENAGDELSRTLYSQTSIFCVEYCLLKLWESWGVKPDFVLGHSLGEFAAAVAVGALTFEDALMLVAERSRLIDNLPHGKMLVIRADKKTVDLHIAKYKETHPKFWADYAALNSADQTVIAGDCQMIEDFAKYCDEKSLKAIVLAATHAFHSRHMNPMLEEYRKVASSVIVKKVGEDAPKYISGMDGKIIELEGIGADYWVRHTREKVSFMDACKALQSENCSLFIEVGPHPVLSALVMMNLDGVSVKCFPSLRRKEEEWATLLDSLSKLHLSNWRGEVDWKGFDQYYSRERVNLPFYPFNKKPVWIKTRRILGTLHPLLGKAVLNASNQSIYERHMTNKNVNFSQDHVIGNTIIFPGAGFLEMALSAGYASVHGLTEDWAVPRRAIGLSNLKIAAPLALSDTDPSILQTVVTLNDKDESELSYSVSIYRNKDSGNSCGGQWVLHASGTFQPVVQMKGDQLPQVDIKAIQTNWEPTENKDYYEKLPEVGLRFGPKFQSLQSGWSSEEGVLLEVKVPEEDSCDSSSAYLIHPVVGDAMLQAVMLWRNKDKCEVKKKLQVPVLIGEFTWLSSSQSCGRYIYCSKKDNVPFSLLLDDEGQQLAYMSSVEFTETTVKLIEGMIQQQTTALPSMWEDVWKPKQGPLQNRSKDKVTYPENLPDELEQRLVELNDRGDEEREFTRKINDITNCYFLEALYELGWKPEAHTKFPVSDLIANLGIKDNHKMYVRYFLRSLALSGFLEMVTADEGGKTTLFHLSSVLPSLEETVAQRVAMESSIDKTRVDYRSAAEVGNVLPKILLGELDPLTILFTEDPSKPHVRDVYDLLREMTFDTVHLTLECFVVKPLLETREDRGTQLDMPTSRILEVGAGTGAFSRACIDLFLARGGKLEYFYTDVSAVFFKGAQKRLGDTMKHVVFKRFDMEMDPFEQGLCPWYFDAIMCCEVLHVSKDIEKTLKNLRPLLKPGGVIQIIETIKEDPRLTFPFGLLDGYWRFEDFHRRSFHASIPGEKWVEVLQAAGFPRVEWRPANNGMHASILGFAEDEEVNTLQELGEAKHSWLIFEDQSEQQLTQILEKKMFGINRKVVVVPRPEEYDEEQMSILMKRAIDECSGPGSGRHLEGILYLWGLTEEVDQAKISLPFLSLCKLVCVLGKAPPRIYVVTQGNFPVGDSEVFNPSSGTLRGMLGTVFNENSYLQGTHMDLAPSESAESQVEEIFQNLWYDHNFTLAFREGKRLVPKMASVWFRNDNLPVPQGCSRFQLQLPETKLISDLEFTFLDNYELEEDEIEVRVMAYALNFRDVFAVLKPTAEFDTLNALGLDFSGIVTRVGEKVTKRKVGDKVIGMNTGENYAMPTHVKVSESMTMPHPTSMTFAEGSTMPAVFLTSFHSLVQVAEIQRGETVLIHTASGGVGLCAVQVANHFGANIIATAGSPRKQNYLKNLGIQHVFHSRTTEFSKHILEVTNGKGVDIVLNSITGPGFKEASLDCLAKEGRFIEMSKLNVWKPEEVKAIRPDVFYEIVDLTKLERSALGDLNEEMERRLEENSLKPIPYDRFDALNIRSALNYLQKAKHIGKVVCVMPELTLEKSNLVASTPIFNEESTYIITGGLGGIGFALVKFMLDSGARHLALVGRSPPKPQVASQIESWNKGGLRHVQAFSIDVGNFEECRKFFEEIRSSDSKFPTIRGVMHAAGVLHDDTIDNQSWSTFRHTFNPKVDGTWNLHNLTKNLPLEHFVLFSSGAACFGTPGQANHAASNSFEDTFAHYRKSNGLPATTVNWANWGEVGVATEIDFPGVRPISTSQGMLALETFLRTQRTHTIVANVDSFALMATIVPTLKHYVDDKRLLGDTKCNVILNSDEFWAKVDTAESRDEKLAEFKYFIKSTIRTMLQIDAGEEIDDNAEFQSLGIDSLMLVEMKNGMQNVLGRRLTLTAGQLRDCTNVDLLSNRFVDVLEGNEDTKNVPSQEDLIALIREDSILPEHIVPPSSSGGGGGLNIMELDEVRTVLLTGVTGTLAPYLLRDLSQKEKIEKIYCLIRKRGKVSTVNRLHSKLTKIHILDEVNMEKVECVEGDVTLDLFGLAQEAYDELAGSVDAIVHSAVHIDHNAKYWKAPASRKNHVRTVNVFGMVRILEFAVSQKLKHVYHASTLLTVTTVDEKEHLCEDWQDVGAFDELTMNVGNPVSKHICEQLVRQAVDRGIPCKMFRFPFICGDSRTGRSEYENSHFLLRCLGLMKLGYMQDLSIPMPAIPIDKCAQVSLSTFFNARATSHVYNVCPRNPGEDQVLVHVAKEFGVEIKVIPYPDFVEKMKTLDENSPLAPFAKRYTEDDFLANASSPSAQCMQMYLKNSKDFFTNDKISELDPGFEEDLEPLEVILRRELRFLEKSGVFKKFGIGGSF